MAGFVEEFDDKIKPVVVAFILYNIVGVFGNLLVIFVYGTRYPENRFRCLVLVLSLVDLTSCCTTVPMETASTWYWFSTPSRGLCKAKNFFVQFTGLSAMYMLFVTAVCKYRQICTPFKKQVTIKVIVILCSMGIFVSLALAVPAGVIWDINKGNITVKNHSDFVTVCEVHKEYQDTLYPQMYRNLLSFYDIFLLATIVLYFFVARATYIHVRNMRRCYISNQVTSATPQSRKSQTHADQMESDNGVPRPNDKSGTITSELENNAGETSATINDTMAIVSADQAASPSRQTRRIHVRKVLIMMIIAGSFSVTFLMSLTFGYVFALYSYKDFKSVNKLIALFCCYRFYFINYCLNPIVYFSLDTQFRVEVMKLLTCHK